MLNKNVFYILIHVIIPITIGGLIYISFRSLSLRMFNWFDLLGIKKNIMVIRCNVFNLKSNIPSWVYNSLPDALWMYSYISALLILWNKHKQSIKYWIIFPILIGPVFEICQGLKIIPGTFDIVDFIFYIFAIMLSIIFVKPKFYNNENK